MREKLIDIVCDAAQINGCIHWCNHPPCAMVGGIVDALIANGVTIQEWIPVSERLPEKGKAVLCFCINNDYWVTLWDRFDDQLWSDGEWWRSKDFVTHWMPLPQPPKGG